MRSEILIVIFALETFTCLGEQAFLSQRVDGSSDTLPSAPGYYIEGTATNVNVTQGFWGDYLPFKYAKHRFVACGVRVRDEKDQGWGLKKKISSRHLAPSFYDDTATNAIELIVCNWRDWREQQRVRLNEGNFGDWSEVMCDEDHYMYGAIAQVNPNKEGNDHLEESDSDDTAFSGIEILCADKYFIKPNSKELNIKPYRIWDYRNAQLTSDYDSPDYKGYRKFLELGPKGYRVIGGRVRFEKNQGDGDDTSLNGLELTLAQIIPW
jgi:hypothetical protein